MSTKLSRLSELAKADKTTRFLSMAHLLTPAALLAAFEGLRKDASAGVDKVTYREYEQDVWRNIPTLHHRLVSHPYRAPPLRRVYIPKENGKQRPISIPALEDKIVQKATVTVLNAIYEQDFLPCSYGFRPGRSPHDALDAIIRTIGGGPMAYVLEADIQGYFDAIVREQLTAFVERRIGDSSILRLIRKWIHVGVIEDGRLRVTATGTGQGQGISPLLANIYLHYVLDEWFEHEVKPRLRGQATEVRYADDFILCFQYREDAERVLAVLSKRLAKYGLTLHPEKTRLVAFGRSALPSRPDMPQPATFDFLGFTHVCARSRRGRFTIHVRTIRTRLRRSVKAVAQWCQPHRHDPVETQAAALNAKLRGHYQYYGRPTNLRSLRRFYRLVLRLWHKWLNRRSRGKPLLGSHFMQRLRRHPLLLPRLTHAWPTAGSPG
jgi:RNA-directed DNA polymerase